MLATPVQLVVLYTYRSCRLVERNELEGSSGVGVVQAWEVAQFTLVAGYGGV